MRDSNEYMFFPESPANPTHHGVEIWGFCKFDVIAIEAMKASIMSDTGNNMTTDQHSEFAIAQAKSMSKALRQHYEIRRYGSDE